MMVTVPAGCDLNAELYNRQGGYPFFWSGNEKAMETARYLDAVNFAPRIRAKSLVAMGFVDTVCPPAGIWTAFNRIRSKKEVAPMVDSPHNNLSTPEQQKPWTDRSEAWFRELAGKG
jgi:cephalosporin-C deacetylase-like acetyl esterase